MMNGNFMQPQQQQPEEPPTIEGLQRQVVRLQQYLEVFRQQRDQAMAAVNNLQADLAVANHQIGELEKSSPRNGLSRDEFGDRPN